MLYRLKDWKVNISFLPGPMKPSLRQMDDLRSEAEALAVRAATARQLLEGHAMEVPQAHAHTCTHTKRERERDA